MLLLALACATESVPPPPRVPNAPTTPVTPDHMAQMTATRDRLRTELGAAYDEPVEGLATADLAHGRTLFESTCAACHGAGGKGDGPAGAGLKPPPADFTDPEHASFYSDQARMRILEQGVPGTGMASFAATLSTQDRLDVYAYVKSLRGEAGGGEHHHNH